MKYMKTESLKINFFTKFHLGVSTELTAWYFFGRIGHMYIALVRSNNKRG